MSIYLKIFGINIKKILQLLFKFSFVSNLNKRVFNQVKVRYFRIILPFESRGNFFLPLLFGIDSGWSKLFVFDAWWTFFDYSGVFFLAGGLMARAYVTWTSTRCLSLSSGAKLAISMKAELHLNLFSRSLSTFRCCLSIFSYSFGLILRITTQNVISWRSILQGNTVRVR